MTEIALRLLELLSEGHQMTQDELDEFLSSRSPEDLYLEYKHGKELLDAKKAGKTIRQYLSGFANSAGGILFVGIDENDWSVTGCSAPGGGDLSQWASRCLTPIAPYFSPVPRFSVVRHQRGDVLIASTARSLGLVPCIEEGRIVHYFRLHDQMLEAPEYLVSDLVLGRRQSPYLSVGNFALSVSTNRDSRENVFDLVFLITCNIANESLAWAEDVRLGVISLVKESTGRTEGFATRLLSHIDIQDVKRAKFGSADREQSVNEISRIEPFQIRDITSKNDYRIPLSKLNYWYTPYTWKAAIYIIAKQTPPVWYQVSLTVSSELLQFLRDQGQGASVRLTSESNFIEIKRLVGERPVVAWESIEEA